MPITHWINMLHRFARENLAAEQISARKFLEAAQNSQDSMVFYGVYKFFQLRNQRARGNPSFLKGFPPKLNKVVEYISDYSFFFSFFFFH